MVREIEHMVDSNIVYNNTKPANLENICINEIGYSGSSYQIYLKAESYQDYTVQNIKYKIEDKIIEFEPIQVIGNGTDILTIIFCAVIKKAEAMDLYAKFQNRIK